MKRVILALLVCSSLSTLYASDLLPFNITSEKLDQSITAFCSQSGYTIELPDGFEDYTAKPVVGSYPPKEALALLLSPSGLIARFTDERTAVVEAGAVSESMSISAASLDLAYRATVGATGTRTDTLLKETPQAIQVVSSELMAQQEVRRIGGALTNVSNVQERGSFLGAYEQFAVRGFALDNRTNYYRDGRKYSNFVAPATEVLERVEVLKGPGSVLFGQANPGGIVNFVTQQAPRERHIGATLRGGDQGHRSGSLNYGDAIGNSDKLFLRVICGTEEEDRFRDFIETDRRVLYGSLRYEISKAFSLTVHFDDLQSDTVADSGLVAIGDRVVDQPLSTNYNEPWAVYNSDNSNMGYRLTSVLSPSWQIRQSFNAQRLTRLRIDAQPVQIDETNGLVFRRARERNQDFDNDFADIQLIGDVRTGRVGHTLMFGAEYVDEVSASGETQNVFIPISLRDPEHILEQPEFVPRTGGASIRKSSALYVQDQIEIEDRFDLVLGLRYDNYDTEVQQETTPGGPKATLFEVDDNALTSRVGAVWHAFANASFYMGYTEGFVPNLDTRSTPPAYLDPEESRQYELGAKMSSANNRFSLNLAVFDLEKSNVLRFDPRLLESVLVGVQAHKGFELDAGGQLLPGWTLNAAYAYLDAEIEEDLVNQGNRPQNVADHSGSLWTSYRVRSGGLAGLRLSGGLRMVGARYGDDAESFEMPGYERVDLGLGYRAELSRVELDFNLKAENVFDEEYYLGALGRTQITPGDPRRLMFTTRVNF